MRTLISTCAVLFVSAMTGLVFGQEEAAPSNKKMITIEVVIAQFSNAADAEAVDLRKAEDVEAKLHELEERGAITSLSRVTLTTLDGSKAMVQVGQRVAVPTGRTFGRQRGGDTGAPVPIATSYSEQDVGTLVSILATVQSDGSAIVDLQVEQSEVASAAPRDPGDPGAADFSPPKTTQLRFQSTVTLPAGHPIVVGGIQEDDEKQSGETVILASVR